MKQNIIALLFLSSLIICKGQGMRKFEIWGWQGSKEDFRKIYLDRFGKDLNETYACTDDLKKMGYKNPISELYPTNARDFFNGKLNWDSLERLVIIRECSVNKIIKKANNPSLLHEHENYVFKYSITDSVKLNEDIKNNPDIFEQILLGTLTLNKFETVGKSNNLLNGINPSKVRFTKSNEKIMACMLSFPFPETCISAMNIISKSNNHVQNKNNLFSYKALTILDFLHSDIQSFKIKAINFLVSLYPEHKDWSPNEWINWLEKQNG